MALLCGKTMPKLVQRLCDAPPKRVVLSGPSGFLGSRVLDLLLQAHDHRINAGLDPGEVILLSSSPGRLMGRLSLKYPDRMKVRVTHIRPRRIRWTTSDSYQIFLPT